MSFRIIRGEKSKSCLIVAVGGFFYFLESAFEGNGPSVLWGTVIFLAMHGAVLLARRVFVNRNVATGENIARTLKFVVVAVLTSGLAAVCVIYATGRAFNTDWRAYINALVIGGLSAIFHLVPWGRLKAKHKTPDAPH
jgi:hypothetical protein